MDDLTTVFIKIKDEDGKLMSRKEAENFEKEVHNVTKAAKGVIRASLVRTQPTFTGTTVLSELPVTGSTTQSKEAAVTGKKINRSR